MRLYKKFAIMSGAGVVGTSLGSVAWYATMSAGTQAVLLFYLVVISAWTSFFGLFGALYSVYKIDDEMSKIDKFLRSYGLLGSEEKIK